MIRLFGRAAKIMIPFTYPAVVGRFVCYCHIFEHEGKGMFANLVLPR